ncbi:SLC5 family protein [Vibrio sp. JC009]|uniref:SLC5 family protein n=1 Tax=Vibrio sp. JC009 TaxID=2912314 RepID=UPI0023B0AA82|nr:SLC5 family protein [Vibrio sp. JC009]WED22604.1 SLC5 family protein [Vibrio sp. JC009]
MDVAIQLAVFFGLTALVGYLTYKKCAEAGPRGESAKDYFLAGGGLSWVFIAGSITLTNLSTDQLVGMNGNQMALLALWEICGFVGLLILAKVFVPIYYKYNCTTTTELLERRYNSKHIRATVGTLFLLGNIFIYLPAMLYGGALFMQSMFNVEIGLMPLAIMFAVVGSAYAIFGGLRAVAVSDTFSGVGLLLMALLIVFLALNAIDFDFSGIPAERLTLIGDENSPIPWPTLLTGMLFIQIYYWSTNQTITQRAMAAENVKEAQKGVLAAACIRILIVPAIVIIPGIVSYKLYGDIGDAAYGRIVGELLPSWLSGAFAAVMAAAVLTSFNSVLNSSAALYVCDIHQNYFNKEPNVKKLNNFVSLSFVVIALLLVPAFATADSLINLLQQLNGLLSMPILSAFITGLLFRNVRAESVIMSVVFGTALYGYFTFGSAPFGLHYIHLMAVTLIACVVFALTVNKVVFKNTAEFVGFKKDANAELATETN